MPLVEEAVPAELEQGDMTIVLGSLYHAGGENNTEDEQRETVGIFFTKGFYRQAENEYLSVPPELCKGLKLTPEELRVLVMEFHSPLVGSSIAKIQWNIFSALSIMRLFDCNKDTFNDLRIYLLLDDSKLTVTYIVFIDT
ncbi:unnamed protein product [Rotaria sp. Silwood1]|nr:unnamed protein product [Rotaria sp. Silwood1]